LSPETVLGELFKIFGQEFIIGPKALELASEAYGIYCEKFPKRVPEPPEKIDLGSLF
jgi:hypothetical protein